MLIGRTGRKEEIDRDSETVVQSELTSALFLFSSGGKMFGCVCALQPLAHYSRKQ